MLGTRIVGIAAGSLLTASLALGAAPHASVRHTAAPAKTAKAVTAKHVRHAKLHKSARHAKLVKHARHSVVAKTSQHKATW